MIKNSRFAKVAVSAGLVVASGAAVLGLTSFASAKVASNRATQVQTASAARASDAATSESPVSGASVDDGSSSTNSSRPNPLSVAATSLGMSESDLVAELQAGKSIADVAKERNIDLDTVIAALTADFSAHLDAEVKSGKHTQAEADAKLAEFKSRVTEMVNAKGLPPMRGDHGPRGKGHGEGRGRGARFATENLAKSLKLTVEELNTQLASGKSLADIAKAQGVDIADVKDVLVSDFTAHLDAEVKSGEHTQAEADAKLAEFKTRLDDMVNGVRPAGGPKMGGHGPSDMGGRGARFATENLAKSLKLTVEELNTQLASGKSLADIAKAQGVDIADVKDVLVSDFGAHLDAEVKSGEHTQAEADAKLAEFKTRLDDMVNGVRPAGGPKMGGHGPSDMGGRHGGPRGGRHGGPRDGRPPMPGQPNSGDTQVEGASFPA